VRRVFEQRLGASGAMDFMQALEFSISFSQLGITPRIRRGVAPLFVEHAIKYFRLFAEEVFKCSFSMLLAPTNPTWLEKITPRLLEIQNPRPMAACLVTVRSASLPISGKDLLSRFKGS